MEQLPLDLNIPPSPPENSDSPLKKPDLEKLTLAELGALYKKQVGYDPAFRFSDRPEAEQKEILIEGIMDREKALVRLRDIDRQEDREARAKHWSN